MKDDKPRRPRYLEGKSWSERNELAEAEYQARRDARKNEPKMKIRMKMGFKFDSMFGWLGKLFHKSKLPAIAFCALCMCGCSVTSSTRTTPDGVVSKFYNGAVGGKGGAVQGGQPGQEYIAVFYDNEKSFRDGVIGLVTYGLGTVVGSAVEAGQAAKTAQNAANQAAAVTNAKTAANVANTTTTANLIKNVGLKGEVPISAVGLPASP